MQTTKDRLTLFLDYLNIGQAKFAELCGLSKGFANNVGDAIRVASMNKILAVYPELNKSWLLTGEGEMLKSAVQVLTAEPQAVINYEQKGIPFYEVDFICGFDVIMNDQTVNPEYYVDFKPYNSADFWVRASGGSMEPAISSGDAIAIKEIYKWREYLPFGEIYAIVTEEFRTIKIISKGSSDDTFSLIPINQNPKYGVQEIPRNLITKIFHVLGSVKHF